MVDIEYGRHITKQYAKFKSIVEDKRSRKLFAALVVVTMAILIQYSYQSIDTSIMNKQGFSLVEEAPEDFVVDTDKLFFSRKHDKYRKLHIKNNAVNQKIQTSMLNRAKEQIQQKLAEKDWTCIHIRYFDIDYDIIVFRDNNIGMLIEPNILGVSSTFKLINELDIEDNLHYINRPTHVNVEYKTPELLTRVVKLDDQDAYCYAHYYQITR